MHPPCPNKDDCPRLTSESVLERKPSAFYRRSSYQSVSQRAAIFSTFLFIELIDRVLNESKQFCYGRIRKLPIPNAIVETKKAIFYGVPTVAILDRFSNAAAVEIRRPPAFEGSLARRQTWRCPQTGFETIILLKDHTERAARRPPVWRIGKHQNAPRLEVCFD